MDGDHGSKYQCHNAIHQKLQDPEGSSGLNTIHNTAMTEIPLADVLVLELEVLCLVANLCIRRWAYGISSVLSCDLHKVQGERPDEVYISIGLLHLL